MWLSLEESKKLTDVVLEKVSSLKEHKVVVLGVSAFKNVEKNDRDQKVYLLIFTIDGESNELFFRVFASGDQKNFVCLTKHRAETIEQQLGSSDYLTFCAEAIEYIEEHMSIRST